MTAEPTKATNPKEAIGSTKPYTSQVPSAFVFGVGLAMLEGGCKYRSHNYRVAGVRVSTYYNAAQRHLKSFWEGENIDPQSGIHHLLKASACMAVVFDSLVIMGNATDDRPPAYPADWMRYFEDATAQLLARFPEPKPPHTEIEEREERMNALSRLGQELDGGLSFEMPVSGTLESVRIDGVDYPVGARNPPEPEFVQPARILVKDLKQGEHDGLTFRCGNYAGILELPDAGYMPKLHGRHGGFLTLLPADVLEHVPE